MVALLPLKVLFAVHGGHDVCMCCTDRVRCVAGQVYVHHYVSSTTFLLGSGAELRGQMDRKPVRARAGAAWHHGSWIAKCAIQCLL